MLGHKGGVGRRGAVTDKGWLWVLLSVVSGGLSHPAGLLTCPPCSLLSFQPGFQEALLLLLLLLQPCPMQVGCSRVQGSAELSQGRSMAC